MAKYTEAQARSAKKYLKQFAEIKLRMRPEEREQIKKYAEASEKSVNQYILDKLLPLRVKDQEQKQDN